MKNIKYKVVIILLSFLCVVTCITNNSYERKVRDYYLQVNNVTVDAKPKKKYTLYDALNMLNKYDSLEIKKINLEGNNECDIQIKYCGDFKASIDTLEEICNIEEVIKIENITINSKDNTADFNVKFLLMK
ncbi:hypothetical protein [Clostridium tunisiense]|uniref:hypothetical protein n=1 Tax=Clostridium tunisiense TaxID=219748 RepID=UPI0002F5AFDB|nr:hypothetical protein [Clostridium tunisiense]